MDPHIIHTTIGIYPNGDYKVNGVKEHNLASHIHYNKVMRPGRALMVDGKLVYDGLGVMDKDKLNKIVQDLKEVKINKDTAPYI